MHQHPRRPHGRRDGFLLQLRATVPRASARGGDAPDCAHGKQLPPARFHRPHPHPHPPPRGQHRHTARKPLQPETLASHHPRMLLFPHRRRAPAVQRPAQPRHRSGTGLRRQEFATQCHQLPFGKTHRRPRRALRQRLPCPCRDSAHQSPQDRRGRRTDQPHPGTRQTRRMGTRERRSNHPRRPPRHSAPHHPPPQNPRSHTGRERHTPNRFCGTLRSGGTRQRPPRAGLRRAP